MTACKLDSGQSNPTKCFPPRTLTRRRTEGAGHWLVAYRKAEEQRYRNVQRRRKEAYKECENRRGADSPHGSTLDGPLLLRLHCVDEPSELCSVDISEQKLEAVKPDDLQEFINVAYIDASVNCLSLGCFSSFVSLRELNLSLNGICNMTFHAADFPHLQVLDLSYNTLTADDIVLIGRLPRLKVLHLTGNQLHHLPPDRGSSNLDPTQQPDKEEEDTQFEALEVLMLDNNKLSSGVFSSLANLKRLRYLNLQGNRVSEVPYLQLAGRLKPLQTSFEEQAEKEGLAHTETNLNTAEHHKRTSQENYKTSSFPLAQLQFLNLADNKIAEEEAVMAVALFPMLQEIDIHSNPLTTRRSGDPPLLTYYLQERLGIRIKRKKTQEVMRIPLKVSTDPNWQVEQTIPKKPMLMDEPSPAERSERTGENDAGNSRDAPHQQDTGHFFVTQAVDVHEHEFDLQADSKEIAVNEDDAIAERFTSQKKLMDVKLNPDAGEPVGIQTAVRMLEHTLKNLNVYRDSKPKLDSIQTPYRERERKIKELPAMKPNKQPSERLDDLIREIKESRTITEVPLSRAIRGSGVNKQEQKEALWLLRDMKSKHKMVHKKTMEQAASMESEGNTRHNGEEPAAAKL